MTPLALALTLAPVTAAPLDASENKLSSLPRHLFILIMVLTAVVGTAAIVGIATKIVRARFGRG
jgi:hypothetical protein